jgi:hypothetical protein
MINPKIRNENSDRRGRRGGQAIKTENSVGARILEALTTKNRDVAWLSEAAQIPANTLRDYIHRGITKTDAALAIGKALDMGLELLLTGEGGVGPAPPSEGDMILVPMHDVAVSAGHGAQAVEAGVSPESLGFPLRWLRRRFGDSKQLRVLHVQGDSMMPTLGDGDLAMIDLNRRDPVDGIFVLRVDDQLMVKRVLFPSSRRVLVTSDNRDYDRWDRMIDLESDAARDGFQLIGRVVWVGRGL